MEEGSISSMWLKLKNEFIEIEKESSVLTQTYKEFLDEATKEAAGYTNTLKQMESDYIALKKKKEVALADASKKKEFTIIIFILFFF
jgi:hypothetical protein